MKAKELIKLLERAGFSHDRTCGSHKIFEKPGYPPIAVPDHGPKDLKPGTLSRILKDAGLK